MLRCGDRALDLTHPIVMGVLNVTPDSFSDGGRFLQTEAAVAHGLSMIEQGAGIIDVGGESTRPGAEPVGAAEQLRRVIPVIRGLRDAAAAIVSVDTSEPEVMQAAAAAGAGFINDVRALTRPGALAAATATGCAVGLMHMQGDPRTMQVAPRYVDVVRDVKAFLAARVHSCHEAGLDDERIVIDPGFGFGKTAEHNLQLLRRLQELAGDGRLMVGLSRKSLVGRLTGRPADQRVFGSIALAVIAVLKGASILRAHDVAATVDAIRTVTAVQDPGS